jgi:uncharacterized membrane protein YraQ (UPF0718 family)
MNSTPKTNRMKGAGGWLFFIIVLFIYGVTAMLNSELVSDAIASFTQLLDKVVPVLFIVFFLIFTINLIIEPSRIKKYLGSQSGITGWLVAIIGGVLSTGPVYPWYALLKELGEKGMKPALASTFLYSRAIKLPLLPMLVHYFGMTYTLVLLSYLIIFSIVSGLVMERLLDTKNEIT